MLAYEYYCKQRLFACKRARRAAQPFSETEILVSLEAVSAAIEMTPAMIKEAEQEHFVRFMRLLLAWGISPLDFPDEPYLEDITANFTHAFVKRMETLFVRLESYLHDVRGTARKTGIMFYGGHSKEMQALDEGMGWKGFIPKEPLPGQVNDRIVREVTGVQRRLQRNLDARRQNFIGVEEYIWRSSDDDKVRHAHAQYDDRVFRWDTPPPDGHPGEAFGCRCWAEPVKPELTEEELQRIMAQEGIEPVYPELLFIGIGRAAWVSVRAAGRGIDEIAGKLGERLARYQAERLARQTTRRLQDILMPNGKPIGKPARKPKILEKSGGESEARRIYNELTKNGKVENRGNHPGEGKRLPNGDWIGYRPKSKSGPPTIDLDVKNFSYRKIKFLN